MDLKDEQELNVTRQKLRILEESYEASRREPTDNPHIDELSLRSLKRMINQLKEEIARYEARKPVQAGTR